MPEPRKNDLPEVLRLVQSGIDATRETSKETAILVRTLNERISILAGEMTKVASGCEVTSDNLKELTQEVRGTPHGNSLKMEVGLLKQKMHENSEKINELVKTNKEYWRWIMGLLGGILIGAGIKVIEWVTAARGPIQPPHP